MTGRRVIRPPEGAVSLDLGSGKSASFQQGSLQVVVVPEPDALFLGALGLGAVGLAGWRRRQEPGSAGTGSEKTRRQA